MRAFLCACACVILSGIKPLHDKMLVFIQYNSFVCRPQTIQRPLNPLASGQGELLALLLLINQASEPGLE